MAKSLKQLEIDVKNAQKDKNAAPNDRFQEVMAEFLNTAKVSLKPSTALTPNDRFQEVMAEFLNTAKVSLKPSTAPTPNDRFQEVMAEFLNTANVILKPSITRISLQHDTEEINRKPSTARLPLRLKILKSECAPRRLGKILELCEFW